MWGKLWRVPWCAQTVLEGGFAQCAGIERRVLAMRAILAAGLLLLLAVPVVLVLLYRRTRRQKTRAGVAKMPRL